MRVCTVLPCQAQAVLKQLTPCQCGMQMVQTAVRVQYSTATSYRTSLTFFPHRRASKGQHHQTCQPAPRPRCA